MFLYDATGHVGIGSKFNEQGPPAERLDVDGNTKLKGKLFFERPASNGAYAAASGNALVVPDGEAESLVVRAIGGATFLTLDSSDQHIRVHSSLRFFGGRRTRFFGGRRTRFSSPATLRTLSPWTPTRGPRSPLCRPLMAMRNCSCT